MCKCYHCINFTEEYPSIKTPFGDIYCEFENPEFNTGGETCEQFNEVQEEIVAAINVFPKSKLYNVEVKNIKTV